MSSSLAIYRKYRPARFSEILGQDAIKNVLISQITSKKVSHAYLFTGPRGTGKTSTARLFAQAVNCVNWDKTQDLCGQCDSCLSIQSAQSIDVIEIDAASNRGIDEIRKIKEGIEFVPVELDYKIYIIDEVHMLTKDAFNSLLKTLEEPPKHALFILATTEVHKIPETILSRVQRFDFVLGEKQQLITKLRSIAKSESIDIDDSALELVYRLSGGSYRDAETSLAKVIAEYTGEKIGLDEASRSLSVPSMNSISSIVDAYSEKDKNRLIDALSSLEATGIAPNVLIKELARATEERLLDAVSNNTRADTYVNLLRIISSSYHEVRQSFMPYLTIRSILLAELIDKEFQPVSIAPAERVEAPSDKVSGDSYHSNNVIAKKSETSDTRTESRSYDFGVVVEDIKSTNPMLGMILLSAEVKSFDQTGLHLLTHFEFNKDVLMRKNSKQVIEDSIRKYYPAISILKIRCDVVEGKQPTVADIAEPAEDNTHSGQSIQPAENELDSNEKIPANDNEGLVESLFAE